MMPIARVAIDRPINRLFDYLVPASLNLTAGQFVLVPFGRQQVVGLVIETVDASCVDQSRLKEVQAVLADHPVLPEQWLDFLKQVAGYYHFPVGAAMFSALPPVFKRARLPKEPVDQAAIKYRWVHVEPVTASPRAKKQQQLIDACRQWQVFSLADAKEIMPDAKKRLQQFIDEGWIVPITDALPSDAKSQMSVADYAVNESQQSVIDTVCHYLGQFKVFLLHGVTGSGKTEVYIHLIHKLLCLGKQVLVMVPEINLTPQTSRWFEKRFPNANLVMLHSSLSEGHRLSAWSAAYSGRADIVLGTRLSVFTPMPNLGLIIVDEEHDGSYKQLDAMGYHARDLAIWRAQKQQIPIVLGSATPSFETYAKAKEGYYHYLTLPERAHQTSQLPEVLLVNLREEKAIDGFCPSTKIVIGKRLLQGEQVLVFINRRGYAPVIFCPSCDWQAICPHCDVKLVYHRSTHLAHCHHCGFRQKPPEACPACKSEDILPVGSGTQKIEEVLGNLFVEAKTIRIDRDTMTSKFAFDEAKAQIEAGEANLLIGTQMLAKGHDFPDLTLVVVLDADNALYAADYRATERLFSTLMQVAGRAGRAAKAGKVFIQTKFTDHPLYQALVAHDYAAFADRLLEERRKAGFPPYGFQALLRAESDTLEQSIAFLQQAKKSMIDHPSIDQQGIFCYDPVPMLIAKRAKRCRAQLLVESRSRKQLQQFLTQWQTEIESISTRVFWRFDVDPFEF